MSENIFALTDYIQGKIDEDTVSSDISYIPGGFMSTRQVVRALASVKPKWRIDILDDNDVYEVKFEKKLNISIPKEHYDDFNEKVVRVKGLEEVDLSTILNETSQEMLISVKDEMVETLSDDLRRTREISDAFSLAQTWLSQFRGNYVSYDTKRVLSLENYDRDLQALIGTLKRTYKDATGSYESVMSAIQDKLPFSGLKGFNGYNYLLFSRIRSNYEGTQLIFDIGVNMTWLPVQSVYIDNADVVAEVNTASGRVKASGKVLYPVSGKFIIQDFYVIKEAVDNLEENSRWKIK